MRHGLTQTELAPELGVSVATLNHILQGKRAPGDKVLSALGIRKEIVYVLDASHDIPEGLRARAPKPRPKRRKREPAAPVGRITHRDGLPRGTLDALRPQLTTDRVLIAVKYKLNPRDAWNDCLEQALNAGDMDERILDEHWLSYCETHGKAPVIAQPSNDVTVGGLKMPHLKAVNRGEDHRMPLALGQRPALNPIIVPQAVSQ